MADRSEGDSDAARSLAIGRRVVADQDGMFRSNSGFAESDIEHGRFRFADDPIGQARQAAKDSLKQGARLGNEAAIRGRMGGPREPPKRGRGQQSVKA